MTLKLVFISLIVVLSAFAGYARADGGGVSGDAGDGSAEAGVRVHCDTERLHCLIRIPRIHLGSGDNIKHFNSFVVGISAEGRVDIIDGDTGSDARQHCLEETKHYCLISGSIEVISGDSGADASSGDAGDSGVEAGSGTPASY